MSFTRLLILSAGLLVLAQLAGAQQSAAPPPDSAVSNPANPGAIAHSLDRGHCPRSRDRGRGPDKHIFGVLPNYRTVEGSTPFSPLTAKQKLTIATKDTIDGPSYVMAGLFSALYQLTDQNPSFGQGLKGYARRYASAIADQDIGNYMTEGFIPVLTHEDPRYFRRGTRVQ